jgi:diguanylate cyclase (GGDEF)-like protein
MLRSIAAFLSETIASENSKDHLVATFGAEALEAINTKEGVELDIPKLRDLVTNMLEHYRDEAQKWEIKARQLELIVNVDPLLNTIHNRRALDNHLHGQIEKARADEIPLSLLMIDVDDFKKTINDVYGHQVGDDILRTLAKILTSHASKNNFFAARYGGDELVLVCNLTGDEAEHHAEALRYSVQNYEFRSRVGDKVSDEIIRFTISIGIAEYYGSWTAEDLLNAADHAMYHVKDRGKNSISRFCVVTSS